MALVTALLAAGCGSKPTTALDLADRPVDPLQATNAKAVLLLFVSSTCPICNRYAPEFRRLRERFAPRGVTIWRVYPDADDTAAVIQEHQREFDLPGEALRDPGHALVKLAGANVTPEAALFLPGGRRVYRGRIDDWYTDFGKSRPEPTRRDLQEAIEAVLAGRSVSNATTTAIGCQISRR
jgi:peroxiredoxin